MTNNGKAECYAETKEAATEILEKEILRQARCIMYDEGHRAH